MKYYMVYVRKAGSGRSPKIYKVIAVSESDAVAKVKSRYAFARRPSREFVVAEVEPGREWRKYVVEVSWPSKGAVAVRRYVVWATCKKLALEKVRFRHEVVRRKDCVVRVYLYGGEEDGVQGDREQGREI